MNSKNYIAVDIAKDTLAVHCDAFSGSFTYNTEGLEQLFLKVRQIESPLVVCEATGGYERKLIESMQSHQVATALINPARVRAFARSDGLKAKTDPIDAAVILRFARSKEIEANPVSSTVHHTLQALMDRRSQLTEALTREKNRLEKSPKCIIKSIEKMVRILEKELADIDKRIKKIIDDDPVLNNQSATMQTVTGVGSTTAWTILAYLREITSLGRNQIVSLAGIAPYPKDSGKYKGKRRIEGGRAKVRKCLYMAAQSAAVHNPHIKAYVDALRARGKAYKCAMVAAMRKLLIHLQSLLKNPEKCLA